jgi:hypothetical protein
VHLAAPRFGAFDNLLQSGRQLTESLRERGAKPEVLRCRA